jgi:hypothetical protein
MLGGNLELLRARGVICDNISDGVTTMAIFKAIAVVCASFMVTPLMAIPFDGPDVEQTSARALAAESVNMLRGSTIYKSENGFPDFMLGQMPMIVTAPVQDSLPIS